MNQVILSGHLTRDVETRFTGGGTAVGKFGIAVSRKWKDQQSGELKEETTFVDVDCFGRQAETIAQHFKKGSKILLTGRLKLDTWEDRQSGQKRSKLGVVLESFEFMDSKGGNGHQESAQAKRSAPTSTAQQPSHWQQDLSTPAEEDEVPFRAPLPHVALREIGIPSFNKFA